MTGMFVSICRYQEYKNSRLVYVIFVYTVEGQLQLQLATNLAECIVSCDRKKCERTLVAQAASSYWN